MTGDIVFELSDQTGEPRSVEQQEALHDAVSVVIREHGYKWRTWGTKTTMRRAYAASQARRDDEDTRAMLAEWRRKRDAEENE